METRRRKHRRIAGECWQSLPDETIIVILSYLDVRSLIERKAVCCKWRRLCTQVIDAKRTKVFETNQELRDAVEDYVNSYSNHDPQVTEKLAAYGWPIGKWNVSNIQDFSNTFWYKDTFNEDISQWDVSNATTMNSMFRFADIFNQDLSLWDTSNVTDMEFMFSGMDNFDQNISMWNTSNVTTMKGMFSHVETFNQSLEGWDTSNVTTMDFMFQYASAFNQNLSTWDVRNVTSMVDMFDDANKFDQDVPSWGWDMTLFEGLHNEDIDSFDEWSSEDDNW